MKIGFPPLILALAALACSGAPAAMQIRDAPVFVCPSATPRPTDTPRPTGTAVFITVPPSGWATRTPVPGCIWNGRLCATNTPAPGGSYTTPGHIRPGATASPYPTTTPYPTSTPFVIRPPQPFFIGDPVYTGGFISPVSARLRLLSVTTLPAPPAPDGQPRALVRWQIEIRSLGRAAYEVFPAYQAYVSAVSTPAGEVVGVWGASAAAAALAGLTTPLEAVTLPPGTTRTFDLAAFIPAGTPRTFSFALDPTVRSAPGIPGSNLLVWSSAVNPHCTGILAEPPALPTPLP
ncbi:MAG: hypothetical protein ACUVS2_16805 [Candidatus Flexifilum sp.]